MNVINSLFSFRDASFGSTETNGTVPTNTDQDGDNPDYFDADNDGISDRVEGWDTDGNGI